MVERWMRRVRRRPAPIAGGATDAMTVEQAEALADGQRSARDIALRTGMTIAAAIGLHNFAEGLAIGVSASTGEISLATVLIVGFALHNATEGFGIIGPLGDVRPSWSWLAVAGLVGGGPVFLGSIVGYNVTSDPLELALLRAVRRRDPVCDRRGLDRDAPARPPRARTVDAGPGRDSLSERSTDLVVVYGGCRLIQTEPVPRIGRVRVLITNDDGIQAEGLHALRHALAGAPRGSRCT